MLDERQRMAARDPRHDRPGPDRDRHPARGGRAGRATGPRTGSGTSGTRSAWPARACRRRGDRSRARGPSTLETARLPDALAEVARQWSELNGVPVEVVTTGDVQPLHPEVEVALLRTAQEALANVAKHANASRAGLTLSYMGDVVTLDVRDDGVGFEVPAASRRAPGPGFGLSAMRQRVNRVAGTLAIESEPGGGTAISARVPAIVAPGHGRAGRDADPAPHRRRPPGRARRPARHVLGRPRVRGRRRGRRRRRGDRARRAPGPGRDPDGPADARRQRRGRDPRRSPSGRSRRACSS